MGHHDLFLPPHPLRQILRGDGGGGGGDGLQLRAGLLQFPVDLALDLQLFRDALKGDFHLPQSGVVLREGQQLLAGGGLLLRHQALGNQVPVISPVFLQPGLAVLRQDNGGDAVSGKEHGEADANHTLADDRGGSFCHHGPPP